MEITPSEAKSFLLQILRAGGVPFLKGSPGIGKSDIIRQVLEELQLELIDFRLAQADPTDLLGLPFLDKNTNRSFYAPPATFPLKGDPIPEGKRGFAIFLDEVNSASLSVQVASYKLTLDRMVGNVPLHEKCVIICAGNLESDRAVVNRISTAMQSRLIHLTLGVNKDSWIEFAHTNKLDHRVISNIEFRPEILHKFDPKHSDDTFPCPRTWHFLSNIVKNIKVIDNDILPLVAGTVGEGAAHEFIEYTKIYKNFPTIQQIKGDPDSVKLNDEPSLLFAVSGMLSSNASLSNMPQLMKVLVKMPIEFQIISMKGALKRNKDILKVKEVVDWVSVNAKELM